MPPRKKQKSLRNSPPYPDTRAAQEQANTATSTSSTVAIPTTPSWKGAKRRRASLEKFIDGPVDIVVEVLVWLHPRDLCTLVRTSSVFKNFLLSKDRRQLWKTIIANATDLPPQPPFLSEPAFVHLLYSHHCHNCGTVARQVITEWFKRACSKCIPEISLTWSGAMGSIRALGQWHCIDLHDTFNLVKTSKSPFRRDREKAYRCSKADVDRYLAQLRTIKAIPDYNEREKAYRATNKELMQQLEYRRKYSAQLQEWFAMEERNRLTELDDKRNQRFNEIIQRLRDSEWANEIEFLSPVQLKDLSTFPVVRRSSKLTKSEWSSVLVALDDFLNETRERRLSAEREEAIRTRLAALEQAMLQHYVPELPRTAAMDTRPDSIEFTLMDQCKALVDAPAEQTVTREDFLVILPGLHKKWQTSAKTRTIKAVQRHLKAPSISIATHDPLNLAVAVFVCEHCFPFACMRYPEVLGHTCGYTSFSGRSTAADDPNRDVVYTAIATTFHVTHADPHPRERFSLNNVVGQNRYIRDVLEPMCAIVRALGLDPSTSTAADLEACDARLRCATCVAKGKPDVIYGWDAALFHFLRFSHFRGNHGEWKWELVAGAEMDEVRKLEAAREAHRLDICGDESTWACSLCASWDVSGNDIKAHLLTDHGLSDPDVCVRNGVIYVHPAKNTALMRPPVTLATAHGAASSAPEINV
ncbi:hypothetical protein V8D89_011854 [Ganoderma adspersum]